MITTIDSLANIANIQVNPPKSAGLQQQSGLPPIRSIKSPQKIQMSQSCVYSNMVNTNRSFSPVNPFRKTSNKLSSSFSIDSESGAEMTQLFDELNEKRLQPLEKQISDEEKIRKLQLREQAMQELHEKHLEAKKQQELQKQIELKEKMERERIIYELANQRTQEIRMQQKQKQQLETELKIKQENELELKRIQIEQQHEMKIKQQQEERQKHKIQEQLKIQQKQKEEEEHLKQINEETQIRIIQQAEMKRKREEESERQKLLQQEQYRLQNEERKRKLEKLRLEEEQKQQEELERKRQHEVMIQMERDKIAQELQVWLEKQKQLKVIYKNVDEERLAVAQKTAEITAQRKRQQELEKQLQEEEHQRLVQQQLEEEERARLELLAEKERAEREKREHQESVLLQSTENEGFVKLLEDVALIKDEVNREVAEFEAAKPHADEFGRFHVVNLALIIPPPPIAQLESVPEFESVREKMKAWIGKLHGMFEAFSRQQLQLCNSRMQSIDLVLRLLMKMKQLVLLMACVGDVLYFDQKFAYLVDCQYLMVEQQTDQQILKRVRQQYKDECGQRLKELKQQFKQNSKNEQALPAIQKAIAVNQALQMEMRNVKDVLQLEMIVSKYKPQLK
ncbi:titin-like [Hexamita inflata]|uniref:Titin-like n=1 Tax=Hexamita inflata TaxID=28002 RepID=A0AA86R0P5_9EUKA|nr:titin-like [Hexamita inflata]